MLIRLLLCLFLIFTPTHTLGQWVEGSVIGVPADNAKRPLALFVRWDGVGTIPNEPLPPNTWVTVDLTNGSKWCVNDDCTSYQPNIPADTKAIFLSGLLIITHPLTPGNVFTCDLWANFRAPGSTLPSGSYQIQTIEALGGSGVRSNAAIFVPVRDRKFELYWMSTPSCPALINLSLQAYVR